MIYLILAVASSALVSIVMRISEKRVSGNVGMLAINYVMCTILAGSYAGSANLFPQTEGIGVTVGLGVLNGFLYLAGFVLLQISVKRNGVVLSSTFMKLGMLVPMVLSVCFFGEVPQVFQIIGFVLAVTSIVLINFEKEETSMEFKAGLLLLLLSCGGAEGMSKVYEEIGSPALSETFLLYTFGVAFVLCMGLVIYRKEKIGKYEVLYGLLIGIPNFFSARFMLKSLETLDAVIAYPIYSVAGIVVVTLAGICFFKERLGKKQWIAIGMIMVALVLLNI